jgi:hypothetical protein
VVLNANSQSSKIDTDFAYELLVNHFSVSGDLRDKEDRRTVYGIRKSWLHSMRLKMSTERIIPIQPKNSGVTIHNRFNRLQIDVNKM